VGNLHLRFDEGRAGRAIRVAFSPTLPSELTQPLPALTTQPRRILSRAVLSVSLFQDHLVLETIFGFSIILRLQNATRAGPAQCAVPDCKP